MNSLEIAHTKLLYNGFKKIGNGKFGKVFGHPNLNYIIKIFRKDDGYINFYKLAIQHQDNPHFPKFRGKLIKIDENLFAIRMEKLSKINLYNDENYYEYQFIEFYLYDGKTRDQFLPKFKMTITEKFPELKTALDIIKNLKNLNKNYAIDLHGENLMMRGDCPVIIDPLVDRVDL